MTSKLKDKQIPLNRIMEIETYTTETNEKHKHDILESEVRLSELHKENLEKFKKELKLAKTINQKPQKDLWQKLHIQGTIKNIERERIFQENRISQANYSLTECTFQPSINYFPLQLNSRNSYNRFQIWNSSNKEKYIK